MAILNSGPSIVLYHILPSILAGIIYFLLAQLFIYMFRVKKPSTKYVLYFIVLYKSLLVAISGARYSYTMVPRKSFGFGTMFYDPLDLLPFGVHPPLREVSFQVFQSPWVIYIISIAIIIVLSLLLVRWMGTIWFFRKLAAGRDVQDKTVVSLINKLSSKFNTKPPRIVVVNENIGPLTIGIRKPTIVISRKLLEALSSNEIEVILSHELAHVKRKDNLWQWLAIFLKDLLFFSPLSHITYKLMMANKEMAADTLVAQIFPGKSRLLSKTIEKISKTNEFQAVKGNVLTAKANFVELSAIRKRLLNIEKITSRPVGRKLISKIYSISGLLLFFWLKFWIAIKVGKKALMLLS